MDFDIKELKNIVGKETIYLGNMPLIHKLADFFKLKNNSGMYLKSIWQQIIYRLEKVRAVDSSLVRGKILVHSYFGIHDRETRKRCYWFEKENLWN